MENILDSQFLTNYSEKKFLDQIKKSLNMCSAFSFSVSFIKKAGLVLLDQDIERALARGAIGKIITSTYQNFTDISSLECFLNLQGRFSNFEVHLDFNSFGDNGFHSKGYIFGYPDKKEIIIGSSNITRFALQKNIEWNMAVSTDKDTQFMTDVLSEFDFLWSKTFPLTRDIIKTYTIALEYAIEKWDMDYIQNFEHIMPNYMQRKALREIQRYRDMGADKALVIAATASGKTYLSAFDARNYGAKRLLFVVHRDTILNDALNTFVKVFGERATYGFFMGERKQIDKDFLFGTNTTLSRHLEMFDPKEFDYIIIDEVHHAAASTYGKIIDYFKPGFLLGLTATPERLDRQSVIDIFDKNVPYELRLRDALINDLVVPFHYYGINDSLLDYSDTDPNVLIRQLAQANHTIFVDENIKKYHPNGKLKAIGFCRTVEHARIMSEKMSMLGYGTTYLTGRSDTGERIKAFKDLQDESNLLEIIFCVDILNEGIDVPGINMVLFLRPTESPTIFIQQLGRGLRKHEGKDYLTVLDFIGNSYKRSVQIALAIGTLSNNPNSNKKLLAIYIRDDFSTLDLPIEIHIDELSKEEILKSIEKTNFNSLEFLKQDYKNFKNYLNPNGEQIPKHMDFLNSEVATDLTRFIRRYGSYYSFLLKIGETVPLFLEDQISFIEYLSAYIPLVRPFEFLIIKSLMNSSKKEEELWQAMPTQSEWAKKQFKHALSHLQNEFFSNKEKKLKPFFINKNSDLYSLSIDIQGGSYREHIEDLLGYALARYDTEFEGVQGDLTLYASYSRIQFLQAICDHTMSFREGLKWANNKLYIFIDLKKDISKEEWLKYNDKFISDSVLQWESSTSTTLENVLGKKIITQKTVEVFVRKIKQEDGIYLPYIYLGQGEFTNPRASSNSKKSLLFDIVLDHKVPDYLKYDFQIEDTQ